MAPFWHSISPKTPPRYLQDALGRPSLVSKTAQERPKRRPRCAKNRPRAAPEASGKRPTGALGRRHTTKQPQTPSRPRFRTVFGTISNKIKDHFRWIFGSIVKQIGPMFTQLSTRVLKINNLTRYDPEAYRTTRTSLQSVS